MSFNIAVRVYVAGPRLVLLRRRCGFLAMTVINLLLWHHHSEIFEAREG